MYLVECLCYLTNVNLIICQGVTDEVELERTESLGKLLNCHRIAYKKDVVQRDVDVREL